jgi:hypothetical protein
LKTSTPSAASLRNSETTFGRAGTCSSPKAFNRATLRLAASRREHFGACPIGQQQRFESKSRSRLQALPLGYRHQSSRVDAALMDACYAVCVLWVVALSFSLR